MKTMKNFLAAIVLAAICLGLVLIFARPILIPPGATNVTHIGNGWREFDYKDARYVQSPLGHMTVVYDSKASLNKIIDTVKKVTE